MATEKSLVFWEDIHTMVLHLPTGRVFDIKDMTDIFIESAELNAARAWYNSNLLMDHYMPQIFPCFVDASESFEDTISETFENYCHRIRQRNEGKDSPRKPFISLSHGLMKIDNEGAVEIYFKLPGDECDEFFTTCNIRSGEKDIIAGEILRESGCSYWDGKCYV